MNELDIILRFLLDKTNLEQGAKSSADNLKKLDESLSGEKLTAELDKTIKKLKETERVTKETITGLKAEARLLNAQASAMLDGAQKAALGFTKTLAGQLEGISKLALGTGVALVGGILGFANKYVANSKEATATTIAWRQAQDDLNKSGERFGAVLAKEALPLLKEASRLAEGVASFVEQNPEAVRAALNTGKILIGLGAIGLLVSKGIKLVVDAQYLLTIPTQLQAARLQDQAAEKQLQAALLNAKQNGIAAPTKIGAGIASAALPIAGVALTQLAGVKLLSDQFDGLQKKLLETTGNVGLTAGVMTVLSAAVSGFTPLLQPIQNIKNSLPDVVKLLEKLGIVSSKATKDEGGATITGAAASQQFDAVLKAYEDYKQDDLNAVQKHYSDRKKIMESALAAEQKSNADYAASVKRVRSQTASALASAANDLQQANEQAEIDYQTTRAQTIRDGNQEIEQLQADLQERLRKNAKEHEDRVVDLTNSRDALGLARERDRFKDEQSEVKREARQEIAQRRQEIAQRLSDLAQSYEQERAQRQADYEARRAEIFAQQRQQLAELQAQHAAELREIQQNKVDRIRELDEGYAEERKRRYQQLLQTIRDLDASLLGESNLKKQYYAASLKELDDFLAKYKAGQASLLAVPGKADGGYTAGLVNTGERGVEWIANHNTTRAAEAMIGGRLTQEGLLSALAGAGNKQSVTWNDQRRFDGSYTNEIRRANRRDTLELLGGLFS